MDERNPMSENEEGKTPRVERRVERGDVRTPGGLIVGDDSDGTFVGTTSNPADTRDADNTFAAGDCVAYIAAIGTTAPVGFELLTASMWHCLGWLDTAGGIFSLSHTTKDVGAAGSLTAIRTVITGGNKTLQVTCLEALNPYARALFDDVPPTALAPVGRVDPGCGTTSASAVVTDAAAALGDVGSKVTGTGIATGATIISVVAGTSFTMSANATATGSVSVTVTPNFSKYVLPEVPLDNKYCLVFDTIDGVKPMRLFAPSAKVTARGNDQIQQADAEMLQMTFTFYPTDINGVRGDLVRYMGYPTGKVPTSFSV